MLYRERESYVIINVGLNIWFYKAYVRIIFIFPIHCITILPGILCDPTLFLFDDFKPCLKQSFGISTEKAWVGPDGTRNKWFVTEMMNQKEKTLLLEYTSSVFIGIIHYGDPMWSHWFAISPFVWLFMWWA